MLLIPSEECKRYTRGQTYWCGDGDHPVYCNLSSYKYHLGLFRCKEDVEDGFGKLISEKEADRILDEIALDLLDG